MSEAETTAPAESPVEQLAAFLADRLHEEGTIADRDGARLAPWAQLAEDQRESFKNVADMVLTDLLDTSGDILIVPRVSSGNGRPYVQFVHGSREFHLTVDDARTLAMQLLEGAETALQDATVFAYLVAINFDREKASHIIVGLRAYRAQLDAIEAQILEEPASVPEDAPTPAPFEAPDSPEAA